MSSRLLRQASTRLGIIFSVATAASGVSARVTPPSARTLVARVHFSPARGAALPVDAALSDATGRPTSLAELANGKPLILIFFYARCPMLCPETFNGVLRALRGISLRPGVDYRVVSASFDPLDGAAAARAEQRLVARLWSGAPASSWTFVTGAGSVARLASAAGYTTLFDASSGQYAHAAGFVVLTPDGRVSRPFYGVEFSPNDLRMALLEAAGGRIGRWSDRLLFFCYHYDPSTGRYGVAIMRVLRATGFVTLLGVAGLILALSRIRRRSESQRIRS